MEDANRRRLVARFGEGPCGETFASPTERYRDAAWLAREAPLFRLPHIVAPSAALPIGGCVPIDLPGTSALVIRGDDGVVRAFANACRHRATRLVDAPCTQKAIVCPYHGWTYDLQGGLLHVPHREAFGDLERRDLLPLAVTERSGLVWLGDGVDTFLGELAGDLAALDLGAVWKSSRTLRRCNRKLVIEAFLDGYHIRVLHRDSVYRFFRDAEFAAEQVGPHIRAVTARRDGGGTPSLMIFPSTIVIEHPDFVSFVIARPTAPDATLVEHTMIVPAARLAETEHWDKSWALIEDGVIQREDLWVCEQIQRGLTMTPELVFGGLEAPVRWFHDAIAGTLSPLSTGGS